MPLPSSSLGLPCISFWPCLLCCAPGALPTAAFDGGGKLASLVAALALTPSPLLPISPHVLPILPPLPLSPPPPQGQDKIMNFEITLKPDEGLYK